MKETRSQPLPHLPDALVLLGSPRIEKRSTARAQPRCRHEGQRESDGPRRTRSARALRVAVGTLGRFEPLQPPSRVYSRERHAIILD